MNGNVDAYITIEYSAEYLIIIFIKIAIKDAIIIIIKLLSNIPHTVSYTHLDVYKRQYQNSPYSNY